MLGMLGQRHTMEHAELAKQERSTWINIHSDGKVNKTQVKHMSVRQTIRIEGKNKGRTCKVGHDTRGENFRNKTGNKLETQNHHTEKKHKP